MNFYGYLALFIILVTSLGTLASVTLMSMDMQSIKESEILLDDSNFECLNGLINMRIYEEEASVLQFSGRQIICASEWRFGPIHMIDGLPETVEEFKTHMGPSTSLER